MSAEGAIRSVPIRGQTTDDVVLRSAVPPLRYHAPTTPGSATGLWTSADSRVCRRQHDHLSSSPETKEKTAPGPGSDQCRLGWGERGIV